MRWLLVALLMLAALPLRAAEGMVVQATGFAIQSGADDAASAKRRAVADALLQAALSGGASVAGHTVVDKSVVTADLLIVRPVGRVLQHRIIEISQKGGTWTAVIEAVVGQGVSAECTRRRNLRVNVYAPVIRVKPDAPAWTEPLAVEVTKTLVRRLEAHPATKLVRVTDRPMPRMSKERETRDYEVLTRGSVRMDDGDVGFIPVVVVDVGGAGARPDLILDVEMVLIASDGTESRQAFRRSVKLPGYTPLGRLIAGFEPDRRQLAGQLTANIEAEMDRLLDIETCKPVVATLAVSGGKIIAPVGRNQGLTRGSIAFTADGDHSTEMLEVVEIGAKQAILRPLDPGRGAKAFAGRPVRFVETGL
jgi:hypothetical protein